MTRKKGKRAKKKDVTKRDIESGAARERRRLFVVLYCHPDYGRNGAKAATDAGFAESRARQTAHELLEDEDIRREIDAELGRQIERTRITSDRTLKEFARIGYVNIRDVLEIRSVKKRGGIRPELFLKAENLDRLHPDDTAAIREIELTKDGIRVRLQDKHPALMALARHQQLLTDPLSRPVPQLNLEETVEFIIGLFQVAAKRRQAALNAPAAEVAIA